MVGGVAAVEVKRSKSKPSTHWHPHMHVMLLLDSYIDRNKLADEWKALTGGSHVIDIRRVKGDSVMDGVRESLKYPVKFNELNAADCVRAFLAFRNVPGKHKAMQAVSSFGQVRGSVPGLDEFEDHALDGAYLEWYAGWNQEQLEYEFSNGVSVSSRLARAKRDAVSSWKEAEWIDESLPQDPDPDHWYHDGNWCDSHPAAWLHRRENTQENNKFSAALDCDIILY